MNTITLTGRNAKEIDLKFSQSGTPIANGTIAVRRDFKNKQTGEYETDFFNFVAMGKLGETIANYVSKGDSFGIAGKLQNRVWVKDDGSKQYFTEIMVNGFDFPNKPANKQNGHNQGPNQQPNTNTSQGQQNQYRGIDPFAGNGQIDISDDDLPF